MIMSFEQFEMYIGPGTKPVDHSKNCKVVWDMRVDAGYKYRINGVGTEIRGWKALDTGAVLTFVGTYSFTGGLAGEEVRLIPVLFGLEIGSTGCLTLLQSNARIQITGPQSGDAPFTGKGTPNPVGGITSPCGGGVLNAWYRLSLTTLNNPVGELPIDRDEHPLHIMPSLEWLEC